MTNYGLLSRKARHWGKRGNTVVVGEVRIKQHMETGQVSTVGMDHMICRAGSSFLHNQKVEGCKITVKRGVLDNLNFMFKDAVLEINA